MAAANAVDSRLTFLENHPLKFLNLWMLSVREAVVPDSYRRLQGLGLEWAGAPGCTWRDRLSTRATAWLPAACWMESSRCTERPLGEWVVFSRPLLTNCPFSRASSLRSVATAPPFSTQMPTTVHYLA
jgi:hypothetical protein